MGYGIIVSTKIDVGVEERMGGVIIFYLATLMLSIALCKKRVLAVAIATVGYIMALIDFLTKSLMEAHVSYFILSRVDMTMLEMAPVIVPVYFMAVSSAQCYCSTVSIA